MWLNISLLILTFCSYVFSSKKLINCGACKMIVEELETEIAKVDPKKKIQVGSFRVDPKGNQYLNDVPYARSEVHIHELLENVCDKSSLYGITDHPITKRQAILKMKHVDGTRRPMIIDTSNSVKHQLKSACENILEEHEDDIIKLVTKEHERPLEKFCLQEKEYCDSDDLVPFPIETDFPDMDMPNLDPTANKEL